MAAPVKQISFGSVYTPSRWGEVFHSLPYNEVLGAGAAGPGKTTVLHMEPAHQFITEHERCSNKKHPYPLEWGRSVGYALYLRRLDVTLAQSMERAVAKYSLIDPGFKFNEGDKVGRFSSGYKVKFGHCKDLRDYERYKSDEYTVICYDELTAFEEEQYFQINTRLRTADPVLSLMRKVRAMSNPENGSWVKKYFVDPAPLGNKVLERKVRDPMTGEVLEVRTRMYFPATIDDNPNKEFVRQYRAELASHKPHIRNALLYGDWNVTVGSFHGEDWMTRIHVCKPFKIPSDWKIFRSMDWGYKLPGCVHWWALDGDDNLYCIRELTFQGKTDEEVADLMVRYEKALGTWKNGRSVITGPADTQLWEARGEAHTKTKAATFLEKGFTWHKADKKSRKNNALLLAKRLKDHGSGTQPPGICFFENCVKIIAQVPGVETDPADPELPKDSKQDHWYDSALYACAWASKSGTVQGTGTSKQSGWDDDAGDKTRDPVVYGGRGGRRGSDGYGGNW